MLEHCLTTDGLARGFLVAGLSALAIISVCASAQARVDIDVDKSTQRMTVSVDGVARHVWRVSTGRAGLETPNGHFRPQRMARTWFSRQYYNSPMPHSIFFHGGFAIHGSTEISRLGGPASHGCVRLHPSNAAALYALVQEEGARSTRISVTGSSPAQVARRSSRHRDVVEDDAGPAYAARAYRPVYVDDDAAYGGLRVYAPVYRPAYDWDD